MKRHFITLHTLHTLHMSHCFCQTGNVEEKLLRLRLDQSNQFVLHVTENIDGLHTQKLEIYF